MNKNQKEKFDKLVSAIKNINIPHGALACGHTRTKDNGIDTELVLSKAKSSGQVGVDVVEMLCERVNHLEAELDFIYTSYALENPDTLTTGASRIAGNARALDNLKQINKKLLSALREAIAQIQISSGMTDSDRNIAFDKITFTLGGK